MDNNKETVKRKVDLFRSIMSNKRLSKTFNEAMAAPIGSTKREQAKSILSIMRKVSGNHLHPMIDATGGPVPMMGQPQNNVGSSMPDYSNLMIFPAVPKFKVQQIETKPNVDLARMDGVGGPNDSVVPDISTGYTPLSFTFDNLNNMDTANNTNPFIMPSTVPQSLWPSVTKSTSAIKDPNATTTTPFYPTLTGTLNNTSTTTPATSTKTPFYPTPTGAPIPSTPTTPPALKQGDTGDAVKTLQDSLVKDGYMTQEQVNTGYGTYGPKTAAAVAAKALGTKPSAPVSAPATSGTSANTGAATAGSSLKAQAQRAVDEGTGAGLFAQNIADEKFGGSLDQYINNLDTKLRTDFGLDGLEQQLSALKAEKGNLIPTLQTYMQGKDQYLTFIDNMISKTEGNLMNVDTGNPVAAQNYTNYLNYLYTLKGRQNQRYGNYLNSAIADYNADVTAASDNYTNVYNQYNSAITRQSTIAQDEYDKLYTSMGDLYNTLDQAPTKLLNLEILQQQHKLNAIQLAQNAGDGSGSNPQVLKDITAITDQITDKNATGEAQGALDTSKLGAAGLAGIFALTSYAASDPQAAAKAINNTMAKSIEISANPIADVHKFKTLIADLATYTEKDNTGADVPIGQQLAGMIAPSFSKAAYPVVADYVLNHLGDIKSATNSLFKGGIWGGTPGLQDEAGWKKKYSSLDSDLLTNLYDTTKLNVTPGSAYAKNPSSYTSALFSGGSDKAVSDNVASVLMASW
jgi:hypothetical protein